MTGLKTAPPEEGFPAGLTRRCSQPGDSSPGDLHTYFIRAARIQRPRPAPAHAPNHRKDYVKQGRVGVSSPPVARVIKGAETLGTCPGFLPGATGQGQYRPEGLLATTSAAVLLLFSVSASSSHLLSAAADCQRLDNQRS